VELKIQEVVMPKYVIERTLPGAGKMSPEELKQVARKSNEVLKGLAPDVEWLHSYVVEDKVYCVYNAKNPELIRKHAVLCGGLPVDNISEVKATIDPTTGG
jgi:hypothetical protein